MSCFIVKKATIDAIVTYIAAGKPMSNLERWLCSSEDELGQKLWNMNHDAYAQRYNVSQQPIPVYAWDYRKVGPVALYKHMQCLRYQCHEGTVPDTACYQMLDHLVGNVADEIINQMPEYKEAPWE